MTIDLSVVKKIAGKSGLLNSNGVYVGWEEDILAFAHAIYEIGSADQKEKDAKICEEFYSVEGVAQKCAESIRSQE